MENKNNIISINRPQDKWNGDKTSIGEIDKYNSHENRWKWWKNSR